jgi:hypothetical protein
MSHIKAGSFENQASRCQKSEHDRGELTGALNGVCDIAELKSPPRLNVWGAGWVEWKGGGGNAVPSRCHGRKWHW